MRRISGRSILICVSAIGVFLAGNLRAQAGTSSASPSVQKSVEQQLRPLLNGMMAAANAHDTDRFLATYLRGPDLVFIFNGELIWGWDATRALQLKWWNNGKSDVVYSEVIPARITALTPDIALVVQTMKSQRTLADGKTSGGEFGVTEVWQRRAEGWRIVQVHESTAH